MNQKTSSIALGLIMVAGLSSCTSSQVRDDRYPAGDQQKYGFAGAHASALPQRPAPVPVPVRTPGANIPGDQRAHTVQPPTEHVAPVVRPTPHQDPVVVTQPHTTQPILPGHTEIGHDQQGRGPVVTQPNHDQQGHGPILTEPRHDQQGHGPVVTQPNHDQRQPSQVGGHTEHSIVNNGHGTVTTIVNKDHDGHEFGHVVVTANRDGSFNRQSFNGSRTEKFEHAKNGLNRMTVVEKDEHGRDIEKIVFHEDVREARHNFPGIGRHDVIERRFWDNHAYNYIAWRGERHWGIQMDWFVFSWTLWQPAAWSWYCAGTEYVDGVVYCITPQSYAWDWRWQWQGYRPYHYRAAHEWYMDYLFSRYWLYRHEEEVAQAEAADAYWMSALAARRPYEYFEPSVRNLLRAEIDFSIHEAHESRFYHPEELVRVNRAYIPGADYSVVMSDDSDGSICTITRGSVIKAESMPDANGNVIARVMFSHETQDGVASCYDGIEGGVRVRDGIRVTVAAHDLFDMSNDFRARVQDGLAAHEEIEGGHAIREFGRF